jgi:hypothetical protein
MKDIKFLRFGPSAKITFRPFTPNFQQSAGGSIQTRNLKKQNTARYSGRGAKSIDL